MSSQLDQAMDSFEGAKVLAWHRIPYKDEEEIIRLEFDNGGEVEILTSKPLVWIAPVIQ